MKVLLVIPNFHQPRGNTVTGQRIANGLEKLGVETEVISVTDDSSITTLPKADLVHGFHAYKFYKFMQNLNVKINNFVITLTGTDLNHDLFDENRRDDVLSCLTQAKAIHVFDKEAKNVLLNQIPKLEPKITIIHQGASEFPKDNLKISKVDHTFLFVLPAGIRKVKNIPFAIEKLRKLHDKYPQVRLLLVGPILEEAEGKIVKELVTEHDGWVTYLGKLEHQQMGAIYKQADVILNTSHSEGQSAAILEGMGFGLPVLVANNPGNRNIVLNGVTGMVYDTPKQFLDYAEQLMHNTQLSNQIGKAAKQYIADKHSVTYEASKLATIYNEILRIGE